VGIVPVTVRSLNCFEYLIITVPSVELGVPPPPPYKLPPAPVLGKLILSPALGVNLGGV
jgi:hypothetical protein